MICVCSGRRDLRKDWSLCLLRDKLSFVLLYPSFDMRRYSPFESTSCGGPHLTLLLLNVCLGSEILLHDSSAHETRPHGWLNLLILSLVMIKHGWVDFDIIVFNLDSPFSPLLRPIHHRVVLHRISRRIFTILFWVKHEYPLANPLALFVQENTFLLPVLVGLVTLIFLRADA